MKKKKFEDFEKEYESVYTSERSLKRCKIDKVGVGDDMSMDKYILLLREEIDNFQKDIFDRLVKIVWLFKKFHYFEKRRKNLYANGRSLDRAFGVFMRNFIGRDQKIFTRCVTFQKVISYFDSFFLDFEINNPFETKYEFPYKFIGLEYLVIVSEMDERMELLERAEEKKMGYTLFLDYIINWISCHNERYGEKYRFIYEDRTSLSYVKKVNK